MHFLNFNLSKTLPLLSFAFLLACTGNQTTDLNSLKSRSDILGGESVPDQDQESRGVVLISAEFGNQAVRCTGSLIDHDLVLTASHCVELNQAEDPSSIRFSVLIRTGKPGVQKFETYEVDKVRAHEDFSPGATDVLNDIALLHLKKMVSSDVKPIPLTKNFDKLTAQEPIKIIGYGKKQDFNVQEPHHNDLMTALVFLAKEIDGQKIDLPSTEDQHIYVNQRLSHGVCSGDSGGPLLRRTDKGLEIIGVASFVFNPKKQKKACSGYSSFTNVIPFLKWIEDASKELRADDTQNAAI